MLSATDFGRFKEAIAGLPLKGENEKYERAQLICPRFLLFREAGLEVCYIPFHYVNARARVVLMGLTPGWTQMEEAFRAAKQGIANGMEGEALFHHIGTTGSFSGTMRKNLVCMLNGVGLNVRLGIASCLDLFGARSELVHLTSAVNAPIFKDGKNYRGYGPSLLQVPKPREWIVENLSAGIAVRARSRDRATGQGGGRSDPISPQAESDRFGPMSDGLSASVWRERPSQGRFRVGARTVGQSA